MLDIFELVQSPQRGRHRSLGVVKCVSRHAVVWEPQMLDHGGVGILSRCLQKWHSYILRLFLPWLFLTSLGWNHIFCHFQDKLQPIKEPLNVSHGETAVLIFLPQFVLKPLFPTTVHLII